MIATLASMGKKQSKQEKPEKPRQAESDRHKPRRLVGISERICAALEAMGKERESNVTEMVKVGLIYFLEKHDRWPPRE